MSKLCELDKTFLTHSNGVRSRVVDLDSVFEKSLAQDKILLDENLIFLEGPDPDLVHLNLDSQFR